jgi:hypothetical protein
MQKRKNNSKKQQKQINKNLNDFVNEVVALEVKKAKLHVLKEDVFYDAFVQPFVDVVKTAQHGFQKSAQSIISNTRKVAMQAAVAMMPFVASSEVTRIGKEEKERLKKKLESLDSEYAEVLERNIEAIHTGNAATIAFLMNPAKMLGEYALLWSGGTAVSLGSSAIANVLDFLKVLTSGAPGISKKIEHVQNDYEELSKKASDFAAHSIGAGGHSSGGSHSGESYGSAGGDYGDFEGGYGESLVRRGNKSKSLISEQQPQPQQSGFTTSQLQAKMGQELSKFLKDPRVKNAINSSSLAKDLRNIAIDTALERANKVSGFNKLEQFKSFMGPEFSKIQNSFMSKIPKDAPKEKVDQLEADMVSELKKTYNTIYTTYLNQILEGLPVTPQEKQKIDSVMSKLS